VIKAACFLLAATGKKSKKTATLLQGAFYKRFMKQEKTPLLVDLSVQKLDNPSEQ